MSRILHLSDLHFGRAASELEEPLLESIAQLQPDVVAISGDFTQRARRSQFRHAAEFLERIQQSCEARILCVPGNHDVPLDNLWMRLLRPWARYRASIARELEPLYYDNDVAVVGVNTVNRFAWQRGKVSSRALDRVCSALYGIERRTRIVVVHHPLEHGPETDKQLARGADEALERLQESGADIVLSGHLHYAEFAPFRTAPGLLFVQAGTSLSTRLRGEVNSFNLLDTGPGQVRLTTYVAEHSRRFRPGRYGVFRRGEHGWERDEPSGEGGRAIGEDGQPKLASAAE
ncbi:metallophosphoesterase family protein [Acidimangrovimonas sediminis]|uniref:metallophosphoesterase family protein n=1 Tax=Acidimangrovimonas sediminis TaxID=2056283 RepID=UPI000C806065|nr:metallophosphoesterase family protein [Acidimangrovimonas sediminis]